MTQTIAVPEEGEQAGRSQWRTNLRVFLKPKTSKAGLAMLLVIIGIVLIGPMIVHQSPSAYSSAINRPPTLTHPFGTDYLGRDIFAQVTLGSYNTLPIAILAALGSVILGTLVGVFAGYFERLNAGLSATSEIILALPALPLLILLLSLYGSSNSLMTLVLTLVLWPPITRAIRPQVASLKKLPYVDAAKIAGLSDLKVVFRVVLPGIAPISVAYFVLNVATSVIIVTALEFLGLGNVNVASWGSVLYWAQQFAFNYGDWWWVLAPGLIISLFAISFALMGFAVEEVINPRLRSRR